MFSFSVLQRLASSGRARNVEISPNTNKVPRVVLVKFDIFECNSTPRWYYLYVRNSWRNIPWIRFWQCIGFCWQQWTYWHCVVVRRRCSKCLCSSSNISTVDKKYYFCITSLVWIIKMSKKNRNWFGFLLYILFSRRIFIIFCLFVLCVRLVY